MKTDKATPRPWSYGSTGKKNQYTIDGADETPINCCCIEKEVDAKLIVKAVNMHDKLLKGCKEALQLLEENFTGHSASFLGELQNVRLTLRQAIKQARE